MSAQSLWVPFPRQSVSRRLSNFFNLRNSAFSTVILLGCSATPMLGQTAAQTVDVHAGGAAVQAAVPGLIKYSGTLFDGRGYPVTEPVEVVFSLYSQPAPSEPGSEQKVLWRETQRVSPDEKGAYTIYLGASKPGGLPVELFESATAQWLGVQVEGEPEQARVLLASVPYALKSGDAQTLGGLPASAFALAQPTVVAASDEQASPHPNVNSSTVTTVGGTAGQLSQFTGAATIGNAPVYATAAGNIGIGTASPTAKLEVLGTTILAGATYQDGPFRLPALGAATAAAGFASQPLEFQASAYNSAQKAAVVQNFYWAAEPLNNNSIGAAANLALYYGAGSATPTATGLTVDSSGMITFAPLQKFPGTISSVTPGTGLTGSTFSGIVNLSVDSTKVPLFANNNTFPGTQTFTGTLTSSGTFNATGAVNVSGSVNAFSVAAPGGVSTSTVNASSGYDIGGSLFAFGSAGTGSAYLGFGGNQASTGVYNTAVGDLALGKNTSGTSNTAEGAGALGANTIGTQNVANGASALAANVAGSYNTADGVYALASNTLGNRNTAVGNQALRSSFSGTDNSALGYLALFHNTTGSGNTAVGQNALFYNTTGAYNTAVGEGAGPDLQSTGLQGSTAIGTDATVSQSNSLVLGKTVAGNPGQANVNVGIGTATPRSALEIAVSAPGAVGPALTLTNPAVSTGLEPNATALDFNTYLPPATGAYNPAARIEAVADGYGADLNFLSNYGDSPNGGLATLFKIAANGTLAAGGQLIVGPNPIDYNGQIVATGAPSSGSAGADGVQAFGGAVTGTTTENGGDGGFFVGGANNSTGSGSTPGDGVVGYPGSGSGTAYAGFFFGKVEATGTISGALKQIRIDHPQDPANKYLVHASVESSEMVNVYSGNVVTDDLGVAVVHLPDWFEAENGDFRYQLTVIGGRFAQAIVSEEIHDRQFTISTNASHVKVSWQVTGVRQDAYAKAHPLVVEEEKSGGERGFYLHPELYGQPEEKQTEWSRRPELMRAMKARWEDASTGGERPKENK